jgi:ferredoxin-NADP reductase
MPTPATTSIPADRAGDLFFLLFLYFADAEEGLTVRDVQGLQTMITDPNWCKCAELRPGIENLRARYADLWKDYQKKNIKRDLPSVAANIDAVLQAQPTALAEAAIAALRDFVTRLTKNASPALVKLGLAKLPPARAQARKEIETLLSEPLGELRKGMSVVVAATPVAVRQPECLAVTGEGLAMWPAATLAYASEFTWKRGRTPVVCVAVLPETRDVTTFVFQGVNPLLFNYKPGQFVTLELPIDGKTIRRSYTISSSPSRPHAISITVKRVPDGLVSNWLHDNMRVGFRFNLSGPSGEFTAFDAPAPKILLIAAGSGVTPIMSILRWIADTSSHADVVFLNNIRTPEDVIFARELAHIETRLGPLLKLGIIPAIAEPSHAWTGKVSHFTEELLRELAPDFLERETFVCGPPGYMDLVRKTLEGMGYPMPRYHQESFGAPPAERAGLAGASKPTTERPIAAASAKPAVEAGSKVEIVFSKSAKTVSATTDDFILDLADDAGVKLESSCRAGNCGTCKVKLLEGHIEMDGQQALSETDLEDGYVLLCIGRATSAKVVLDA